MQTPLSVHRVPLIPVTFPTPHLAANKNHQHALCKVTTMLRLQKSYWSVMENFR